MSDQIATMRQLYEAFGRGDVPAVLGAFDPQIEWNETEGMPYGGVYTGPDAVAENVFGPVTNDVADFAVNAEEFFAAGDEVVALGRYTGQGAQSGKQLDVPFTHAWTVRDGKITRFRQYVDSKLFNDALAS